LGGTFILFSLLSTHAGSGILEVFFFPSFLTLFIDYRAASGYTYFLRLPAVPRRLDFRFFPRCPIFPAHGVAPLPINRKTFSVEHFLSAFHVVSGPLRELLSLITGCVATGCLCGSRRRAAPSVFAAPWLTALDVHSYSECKPPLRRLARLSLAYVGLSPLIVLLFPRASCSVSIGFFFSTSYLPLASPATSFFLPPHFR